VTSDYKGAKNMRGNCVHSCTGCPLPILFSVVMFQLPLQIFENTEWQLKSVKDKLYKTFVEEIFTFFCAKAPKFRSLLNVD
jgi:hypothetical protein